MTSTTRITGDGGVIIDSERYLELPKGEDGSRPGNPREGMIRYNFAPSGDPQRRGIELYFETSPGSGDPATQEWRNVALLNAQGQFDATAIPNVFQGKLEYQGVWNAATNTPALPALPDAVNGEGGFYYIVSADGDGNGANDLVPDDIAAGYVIGDWVISTGTAWDKVDYSTIATSAGNVSVDLSLSRDKHDIRTTVNVQQGLERLSHHAIDRINDDDIEGTLTFNNTTDAYLRIKNGTSALPGLSFSTDTNTGIYRVSDGVFSVSNNATETVRFSSDHTRTNFQQRGANGLATAPQYSFTSDTNMGMWRFSDNRLGFATDGVNRLIVDKDGIHIERVRTGNGSAAIPSHSFSNDTNTGMYLVSADKLGFSTGGAEQVAISTTSVDFNLKALFPSGTAALPSITFDGDENTGMYRRAADTVGLTTNGTDRLIVTNNDIVSRVQLQVPNGTAANPSITFENDANTGLYLTANASNVLGIATDGTVRSFVTNTNITNRVPLYGVSGTTAAPTYAFEGDTNTGVYRPGAEQVAITTAGVTRLTASTSTIESTLPVTVPAGAANNPMVRFANNTNSGLYAVDTNSFSATVNAVEKLRIHKDYIRADVRHINIRGTTTTPSYSFTDDSDTGMYSIAAGRLGFSVDTTQVLELNVNEVELNKVQRNVDGNASSPAISFTLDADTGFYRQGSGAVSFTSNGAEKVRFANTYQLSNVPHRDVNGGVGAPQYSFNSATNSGMFAHSTKEVGLASEGVEVLRVNKNYLSLKKYLHMGSNLPINWVSGSTTASIVASNNANRLHFTAVDATEPFKFFSNAGREIMRVHPYAIKVPTGEASDITTALAGMIRYDDVADNFLGFSQGQWQEIGGGGKLREYGTATEPSLYWEADTNTGIYHETANDSMSLTTGGARRINVNNTKTTIYQPMEIIASGVTARIGALNGSYVHMYANKPWYFNNDVLTTTQFKVLGKDTLMDAATGKIKEDGRWLEDKYFTTNGVSIDNVNTTILDPDENGITQRNNTGPVGYKYGTIVNMSSDSSNFQMYAPHHIGTDVGVSGLPANVSSALYFRTGWDADVNDWRRVVTYGETVPNAETLDGINGSQFARRDQSNTFTGKQVLALTTNTTIANSQTSLANAHLLIGDNNNGIGIDRNEIHAVGNDLYIRSTSGNKTTVGGGTTDVVSYTGKVTVNSATDIDLSPDSDTINVDGNIYINSGFELRFDKNSDLARVGFKNTSDGDTDSYMHFTTGDNANEYFKFRTTTSGGVNTTWLDIKGTGITASGTNNTFGTWNLNGNRILNGGNEVINAAGNTITIANGYTEVDVNANLTVDSLTTASVKTNGKVEATGLRVKRNDGNTTGDDVYDIIVGDTTVTHRLDNRNDGGSSKFVFGHYNTSGVAVDTLTFDDVDVRYKNQLMYHSGNLTAGTLNSYTKTEVDNKIASGSSGSSVKLATARTISLSGDATGSTTFDGSANVTIPVVIANDSHDHDTQYLGLTDKAADADKLDGINSGSFLRSDTADIKTAGHLTFNDNVMARFGTGADVEHFYNGSHYYTDIAAGNWNIRDGSDTIFQFNLNSAIMTVNDASALNTSITLGSSLVDGDVIMGVHGASNTGHLWFSGSGANARFNISANTSGDTCIEGNSTEIRIQSTTIELEGNTNVAGAVVATGNVTAFSDNRIKSNVVKIESALDKVEMLNGVTYEMLGQKDRQVGLIAQEVEAVLPEAVVEVDASEKYGIDDLKTVAYGNVSALLVEAIKEEKSKREALEDEVAELKELVKQLLNK